VEQVKQGQLGLHIQVGGIGWNWNRGVFRLGGTGWNSGQVSVQLNQSTCSKVGPKGCELFPGQGPT